MRRLIPVHTKTLEVAITEEVFLEWDKTEQREWVDEHPTSKFADLVGKGKTRVVVKQKKNKEDLQKESDANFSKVMQTKSPEDRRHFLAARKAGYKIPLAWSQVTYYKEPVEGVIARGIDGKGRKQRLEDTAWRAKKIREKHDRIQSQLEPVYDSFVRKLKKQASAGNPEAQVLYLISKTAFRIGGKGDGKAKEVAYGASNLEGRHVKVEGDTVYFDFIGKEGVHQQHTIKDLVIASFVAGKDDNERLFSTNEDKIRAHWKTLGGEKVHDMRSLIATRLAKSLVDKAEKPKTAKELRKLQIEVSKVVAKKLGNKPSESLATYIDANVFPTISEETSAIKQRVKGKPYVLTQYDRDEQEWIESLPKNEKRAMQYALNHMARSARVSNKEKSSTIDIENKKRRVPPMGLSQPALRGSNLPQESVDFVDSLGESSHSVGDVGPGFGSGDGAALAMSKPTRKVKRTTKKARTRLVGYLGGVSSFDLSRLLGNPETRNVDSVYLWRLEVKDTDLQDKPFYVDIYDFKTKTDKGEAAIEDIYSWSVNSDYPYGAKVLLSQLFPRALLTRDYWKAVDFGENAMRKPMRTLQHAAPISDKQRKLSALRKRKAQLREKRNDFVERTAQEIHKLDGEILRVKYDNKPGLKPKSKPGVNKPKKYAG